MAVTTLYWDLWNGPSLEEFEVPNPSWDQVKSAIDRLDADTQTAVAIEVSEESQMLIGGGDGKFLVSCCVSEDEWLALVDNRADSTQKIHLRACGQVGCYPLNEICDYSSTIKAARWYFEHSTLDPSLDWSRD